MVLDHYLYNPSISCHYVSYQWTTNKQRLVNEEGNIQFTEVKEFFKRMTFVIFIFSIFGWVLLVKYLELGGSNFVIAVVNISHELIILDYFILRWCFYGIIIFGILYMISRLLAGYNRRRPYGWMDANVLGYVIKWPIFSFIQWILHSVPQSFTYSIFMWAQYKSPITAVNLWTLSSQ